ncbi:DMT family transporter [Tepidiphilus margaritifer]|uniref:DMT family transporter n=1 Tax=Tepidiphilus margaritifer TaxID=203471 RepID=UPI000420783C|nr:EamA family transporter [Tepidiphilus margaritifer]
MRRFPWIGFAVLLVFDTSAQVCFKYAALAAGPAEVDPAWLWRALTTPWVYGAIFGYLGAFVTWMTLLRTVPIGPAFAASHLEVIGVMIVSVPLFGEWLTPLQWLGAGCILAGVVCLAWGEQRVAPHA